MKYGVLGTGMVGRAIATRLAGLGHGVLMGSRTPGNADAATWAARTERGARAGTFREAARFGDVVVNCTAGVASLDALAAVDPDDLDGKVLIDVANPLDMSRGMPPTLTVCNDDSLGERIQRAFPRARVVKALNTVNVEVGVDPGKVPGGHDLFICGDDDAAKAQVTELLRSFGWRTVIDLGDITNARGTEQLLPLWARLYGVFGSPLFNFKVVRAS